jgi:hypothetical protein
MQNTLINLHLNILATFVLKNRILTTYIYMYILDSIYYMYSFVNDLTEYGL